MNNLAIEVKNLSVEFHLRGKTVKAVSDLSWKLKKGNTLGIVGESGCGKSVSAMSILRLIPNPPGEIVSGEVFYKGYGMKEKVNLLNLSYEEMREYRGKDISMIFQEPMTSLNPVLKIKVQRTLNRSNKILDM